MNSAKQQAGQQAVGGIVVLLQHMRTGESSLDALRALWGGADLQQSWNGTMYANAVAFRHLAETGGIDPDDVVALVIIASELLGKLNQPDFTPESYSDAVRICELTAESLATRKNVSYDIFGGNQIRLALGSMVLLWIFVHCIALQHSLDLIEAGQQLSLDIAPR